MEEEIHDKNWVHYLTRPFNLFSTSLWYRWYSQDASERLFNYRMDEGLFIEEQIGSVRQYRNKEQLEKFNLAIEQFIVKNTPKCAEALQKGVELNGEARDMLANIDQKTDLKTVLEFLDNLLLFSTILPFFVYEIIQKLNISEPEILKLSETLRKESYYMDVLSKIVIPPAKIKAAEFSSEENILDLMTADELLSGGASDLNIRIQKRKENNFFIYQVTGSEKKVLWTKSPDVLVEKIEGTAAQMDELELGGQVACLGFVEGPAKIILDPTKAEGFQNGDILVTINSNPAFMSIIKKCAAIVTDEGGMTCHAAIISRELNIPCIVGTKVATKVLHNGDIVEVDADKGIVKIVNK